MKRLVGVVAVTVVLAAAAAAAQQPPAQPTPGHQMPMHGGMCPMMGGMMGGGMMGMMGGQAESPRVVQMRGEMMKAMGEIMLKYGRMMEGASR
jgi:hypothetical protein